MHNEVHNEVYNLLDDKMYLKIQIYFSFGFVKQEENKVHIHNWVFKLLLERFH